MNLVWGNRYAMTMYEKRPTRWRDLPRRRDDVFLPLLTPWEQGERKIAAVERGVGPRWRPRGTPTTEDRIFTKPVRHLPPQAQPRDRASAGEADRGGDHRATTANLTFCFPSHDPDQPTYSYQEILDCSEAVPELETAPPAWRWCSTTSIRGT